MRVTSAAESAALDHATISGGVPSRALMRAAGFAAATVIVRRYGSALARGVAVFAGPGNNGGDAYVVAAALAAAGIPVRVTEVGESRTPDAQAERSFVHSASLVAPAPATGAEAVVIDGLLGTGSSGAPRGPIADAIGRIAALRAAGARVVALDVPSGVDATTGASEGAVVADLTITFGTLKRGLLIARGKCGAIVVVDIGLAPTGASTGELVDRRWVAARVPPIPADAHKGTRKRLAIVAGGAGMVGAAILASRAAHASGVGLVRLFVAESNVGVVQTAAYESLAFPWPADDQAATREVGEFAHAVLIGPGLGTSPKSRAVVERVLRVWQGPTVVDADALNLYAGRLGELATALGGRPALITPHPAEMGRLTGLTPDDVLARRYELGSEVARELKAAVLLKGVPTVISHGETVVVSATGTPILAAGGSGDLLAGIAGTLLAQTDDPLLSAGCAAWVHGTAAELAGAGRVRGVGLDDVMRALPRVWAELAAATDMSYPVVTELPAVGEAG